MFFRGSPCLTLSFASVAQLRLVRIEASDNVVRTTAKLRLSFLHSPAANAVAGINKAIIATEKCFMFWSCLHTHYVIGQDQDNRRIRSRPNQVREPPLVWSIKFMKKVHVASNDTAPACVPFRGPKPTFPLKQAWQLGDIAAWPVAHWLQGWALRC